MSKTKVVYKDISPLAKFYCMPSSADTIEFVNIAQLNRDSGNFRAYATCEHNRRILDGNSFDLNYDGDYGFWSKQMSKDDCSFDANPVITLTYSTLISFVGLTMTFDKSGLEFATDFNIKYYNNDNLIADVNYQNTSVQFFTNTRIEYTNKIVIEFKKTNIPRRYLKFNLIDYGIVREFSGNELMKTNVHEELSLLSTEVSVNTMDFTFKSNESIAFMFQKKQPLEVTFDGEMIGTFFITKAIQKGKDIWSLQTEDYIGVLEKFSYTGGIFKNVRASTILHDILDPWNIPFETGKGFNDIELSGYLPAASARECLQQVLFAIGCMCDTSRSGSIKMYAYDFSKDFDVAGKIMQNPSYEQSDKVTEVKLTQYDYVLKNEQTQIASGNAVGTVEILFNQPYGNITANGCTITKAGANYAIIEANGAYKLMGYQYEANTTILSMKNPTTNVVDLQNVVEVTNATLISSSNSSLILQKLYDYCMREKTARIKIPHSYISVGEYIRWIDINHGEKLGHVLNNTFNLNGNKIVMDCEVLEGVEV